MPLNPIDVRGGDASDRPADAYAPVTKADTDLPGGICRGLLVFPAYGIGNNITLRDQWRDGTIAGAGLQFVPDEPL